MNEEMLTLETVAITPMQKHEYFKECNETGIDGYKVNYVDHEYWRKKSHVDKTHMNMYWSLTPPEFDVENEKCVSINEDLDKLDEIASNVDLQYLDENHKPELEEMFREEYLRLILGLAISIQKNRVIYYNDKKQ